jgi:hypothetical protein
VFKLLRDAGNVLVLKDEAAFWRYCDATQRKGRTPDGEAAEAEERLDLRAAEAVKALLEQEVGPEEGLDHVQMQNWDWNDDRCRPVFLLRSAFRPELIVQLQGLLTGEFADFQILLMLRETWETDTWGHVMLSAGQVAVQRNVAQAYAIAV